MNNDHNIAIEKQLCTALAELAELLALKVKNKYYRATFDRQAYQFRALEKIIDAKERGEKK